ncbi:lysylphosphatidylglycerol synthase transmembrane domain-containing protein [Leptothermofonsia sp. ETS-13]|uniref:lysylphosphatidylglycerol synthase transmembrane domain-containing protein n=1 Tax=Leptothermofonsia sp. ETS-13 TaxID=3035696 RepID=UPI003B9DCB27
MKLLISRLKPYLRWLILGGTLFFLGKVLKDNWQQVAAVRVEARGWGWLAIALGITLLAHICAGWVWSLILQAFKQSVNPGWAIQTYLKTNIAKYIPGNVWHFYGRIVVATRVEIALEIATVSVLLEPLLMAASALLVAILCSHQIAARFGPGGVLAQWLGLLLVLVALHPRVLNPIVQLLSKLKQKGNAGEEPPSPVQLTSYPLVPFAGELGFLMLRSMGFLLTFWAISPIELDEIPLLVSVFSLSWLLGLVVPGAPGGIGVFEATAIALLGKTISPGTLLSVVALYRLISVLAEAIGAGLAWLDEQRLQTRQ